MQHNLVDEFVLLIHPLVLGSGRQLFRGGVPVTPLRLVNSVMTSTGVIIATYQQASAASR
jgi:riboflavin biosynthesis pyrimidine reductase